MPPPCDAPLILGRAWYDALLLFQIAAFFLIEMLLLYRTSRLGWAMSAKCLSMALLFGFALANVPSIPPPCLTPPTVAIRVLVGLALAWAIYELVAMRLRRQIYVVQDE